ncbi:hypothetical protein [Simkania sp.]|uniref:hypothetical protein n=1 Tax=Simkania sp. TaxID=34094 RepID=UPI003B52568E
MSSRTSGVEPKPDTNLSSSGKGPLGLRNVIELDNWQSYIYFGAGLIVTIQVGKSFFKGEFFVGLTHSGILVTVVMGKIYTDDSLAKFSLGRIAKSMETHVNHLEHEVTTLGTQLDENQRLISRFGHENEIFYQNNAEHRGRVLEMREVLGEYSTQLHRVIEEETEALRKLKEEIEDGNSEKRDLKEDIQREKEALAEIQEKALEAQRRLELTTKHILDLAERASKGSHDSEALMLLAERVRNPTGFGCGSPMSFGSSPYSPFGTGKDVLVH